LNNLNTCNPDTDYVQNLSEEEPGFNYSTYPTAEISPYEDNLSVKGSNQGSAYISSAVGGSVSQISFKGNARKQARYARGGGTRGKIKGFSRVSRRNLLREFATINALPSGSSRAGCSS